jgi:hypothetical protein
VWFDWRMIPVMLLMHLRYPQHLLSLLFQLHLLHHL